MTDPKELDRLADDGCPHHDEPVEWDEGGEWQMECDFCDGDGQTTTAFEGNGRIRFDCPECGGTGWC